MRKNTLFITILLLIVLCVIPRHGAFADDGIISETSTFTEIINIFIKFISRGWTVIAIMAGKLMSNEFIYASGLGLDKTLFTMWNYMKNFANLTLGFMLVFKILKSLFTKDAFEIKKELPKFLGAAILANMSWFLMGAMIDIANVATAAIGSFPQTFMSDNATSNTKAQMLNASIPDKICVNLDTGETKCNGIYAATQSMDRVWARFNDMSGPILYLGTSIFRFQDYNLLNADISKPKDFSIGLIIKILILLMFIAPIIALFAVNLKRIFYLWLRIIFAPIIVLFEVLKMKPKLGKGIDEAFSLKEIIGMVFQPVFVIGGMAIVLILSIGMYSVMGGTGGAPASTDQISKVLGTAEIVSSAGSSTFSNTMADSHITVVGDVFKDVAGYAGGFIGYIIITFFVIMLLWAIVKMSTSSSQIASGTFNSIMKLGQDLVTSANIIPMGGNNISLASLGNADNILKNKLEQQSRLNKATATQNLGSSFYNSAFGKGLQKMYGESFKADISPEHDLGDKEKASMINSLHNTTSSGKFIDTVSDLLKKMQGTNKNKVITTESYKFKEAVFESINNSTNQALKNEIATRLGIDAKDITMNSLFDGTSKSSKMFLEYLQKNLSGNKIALDKVQGNLVIRPGFVIYNGTGVATPPPAVTPPTTPPTQ